MSQEGRTFLPQQNETRDGRFRAADCRFVDRDEFYELAISSRQLERCDDAELGLRGLWDPESGERFMIDEEELYRRPLPTGRDAEPQGIGA